MAEKRMFAKTIIDSDLFLDMPVTAQLLYFHLCMRADDDGFINNPKRIMRDVRCSDDDMKMLVAKDFIIPFESGVIVIKHWRLHNYIRKDRRKPSQCLESSMVKIDERGIYQLDGQRVNQVTDNMSVSMSTKCLSTCQPSDIPSIDKSSIDKSRLVESADGQTDELQPLIDFCNNNVEMLTPFKLQMLEGYVTDFGIEWVHKGLEKLAGLDRSKQNMKYLGGVLDGWKKDGVPKPWEQKKYEPDDDYDPDNRASLWVNG
jgi:DnaD/phage-associated family protein